MAASWDTRHRAALGLTERTTPPLSEARQIALAIEGRSKARSHADQLRERLQTSRLPHRARAGGTVGTDGVLIRSAISASRARDAASVWLVPPRRRLMSSSGLRVRWRAQPAVEPRDCRRSAGVGGRPWRGGGPTEPPRQRRRGDARRTTARRAAAFHLRADESCHASMSPGDAATISLSLESRCGASFRLPDDRRRSAPGFVVGGFSRSCRRSWAESHVRDVGWRPSPQIDGRASASVIVTVGVTDSAVRLVSSRRARRRHRDPAGAGRRECRAWPVRAISQGPPDDAGGFASTSGDGRARTRRRIRDAFVDSPAGPASPCVCRSIRSKKSASAAGSGHRGSHHQTSVRSCSARWHAGRRGPAGIPVAGSGRRSCTCGRQSSRKRARPCGSSSAGIRESRARGSRRSWRGRGSEGASVTSAGVLPTPGSPSHALWQRVDAGIVIRPPTIRFRTSIKVFSGKGEKFTETPERGRSDCGRGGAGVCRGALRPHQRHRR